MGLFDLFGEPPAYVGPGQAPAPARRSAGLFGLFPPPPTYVDGGQPPMSGGFFLGLFPEPPHYVTARPPIPELEARNLERE